MKAVINVRVMIAGMETVRFLCEAADPVLGSLLAALLSQERADDDRRDRVVQIVLPSATGPSAIQFMRSALVGVETEPPVMLEALPDGGVAVRLLGPSAGSPAAPPARERILVQISSYRDTECQWTIRDLFERAAHPDRVFVGVVWQVDPEEDRDCFAVSTRPAQVRAAEFHYRESRGVGWARNQAQRLWRGEEYVLQIDSHMRFVDRWDERMLDQLRRCGSPSPLLSTYPLNYMPPQERAPDALPFLAATEFSESGILGLQGLLLSMADAPPAPKPTAFFSGNFTFGAARWFADVPADPRVYFFGEETSQAARLWTHGWDFFGPDEVLIYHEYGASRRGGKIHWDNHSDWGELNDLSVQRVRHLLEAEAATDPRALVDIDRYGLGSARPFADYQRFSGVDFRARTLKSWSRQGNFLMLPTPSKMPRSVSEAGRASPS